MPKQSAGVLVFRRVSGHTEVLLAHPGGPLYGHKDSWSIPKGELDDNEDHLTAAYREFEEEIGMPAPNSQRIELGTNKRSNGKIETIWAAEGDLDLANFRCNTFTMQWPPKSGQFQEFPENDKAEWFELSIAATKIYSTQLIFLQRLATKLGLELPTNEPSQQSLL